MGIYIKKGEMPSGCDMCYYSNPNCPTFMNMAMGAINGSILFGSNLPKERPENCPLQEVKRPHGKWIDKGWHGDWQFETDGRGNCWHEYECSECGFRNKGNKSNYCPNCGARMKGTDND